MKKTLFFVIVLILSMGSISIFASEKTTNSNSEMLTIPMSENKVMEKEIRSMNERLEEIRDMDKSELSSKDKKELKKELKDMNKKKKGGAIYIGGTTLLLLIILIVILV